MSTLRDQLLSAGLVSEAAAARHNPKIRSGNSFQQTAYLEPPQGRGDGTGKIVELSDLDLAQSAAEFKDIAKRILLHDPLAMSGVIRTMQSFRGREGWGDLPRIMYKVRDQLQRCPADKRDQFLSRALRRNNPQFNIPE